MEQDIRYRKVDTESYMTAMKEIVESGKSTTLLVTGNSMSPFIIHGRDSVVMSPVLKPLKAGDIAFFRRTDGKYIMHRICKALENEFYFVGDAQQEIEGPIKREQIFAVVTAVQRKNVWIKPGDFWWEFFEHVWLNMIPLRMPACRLYRWIVRRKKRDD